MSYDLTAATANQLMQSATTAPAAESRSSIAACPWAGGTENIPRRLVIANMERSGNLRRQESCSKGAGSTRRAIALASSSPRCFRRWRSGLAACLKKARAVWNTMTTEDLSHATIEELSGLLAKRKISPVEFDRQFLRESSDTIRDSTVSDVTGNTARRALRAEKEWPSATDAGRPPAAARNSFTLKINIWTPAHDKPGIQVLRDFVPAKTNRGAEACPRGAILLGRQIYTNSLWCYIHNAHSARRAILGRRRIPVFERRSAARLRRTLRASVGRIRRLIRIPSAMWES